MDEVYFVELFAGKTYSNTCIHDVVKEERDVCIVYVRGV